MALQKSTVEPAGKDHLFTTTYISTVEPAGKDHLFRAITTVSSEPFCQVPPQYINI